MDSIGIYSSVNEVGCNPMEVKNRFEGIFLAAEVVVNRKFIACCNKFAQLIRRVFRRNVVEFFRNCDLFAFLAN